MSVELKKTRQVEFSNLMQALENAEVYAADVARLTDLTPGYLSQCKSGMTNPSAHALNLLRRVAREKLEPKECSHTEKTPEQLHTELIALQKKDPAGYLAASATISTLHSRLNSSPTGSASIAPGKIPLADDFEKFDQEMRQRHAAAQGGSQKTASPTPRVARESGHGHATEKKR